MEANGNLNTSKSDFLKKIDAEKVVIKVVYIVPGSILAGDTYTETGIKIKDAYTEFTQEEIDDLKKKKIEEIFYIPSPKREAKTIQKIKPIEIPTEEEEVEEEIVEDDIHERHIIDMSATDDDLMVSKSLQQHAKDNIGEMYENLKKGVNIDIYATLDQIKKIHNETDAKANAILNLMPFNSSDSYIVKHSINVAVLAMLLAKELKLNSSQIEAVGLGGILHDVGYVNIPEDILDKPGKLTTEEYKIVRKHPVFGYNKLKEMGQLNESVRKIALLHHERINGEGYPFRISYKDIGLFPHIIACADVFDAIITPRPYKKGFSYKEALRYFMATANLIFHPKVVLPFVRYLCVKLKIKDLFNINDYILLNTGEIALVEEKIEGIKKIEDQLRPDFVFRPRIQIVRDVNKKFISRILIRDLSQDPSREIIKLITDEKSKLMIEQGIRESKNKSS